MTLTHVDITHEPDDARRAVRPTAIVAIVASAVLLAASLGANALVHVIQRGTGASPTAVQERAFFQDANSVSNGITLGRPAQFVISPPSPSPITWVAYDHGRVVQRGIAQGSAGSDVVATLRTTTMKHRTWLSISVTGIRAPLRVWVK